MTCLNPVLIPGPLGRGFFAPCGKCEGCLAARRNEWSMRMMHEGESFVNKVFVTLTYRDEDLPEGGNLCKRDVQLFLKRFRKSIAPRKMRYFISGEYGTLRGRPHYHGIFYGVGFSDVSLIEEAWSNGYVKVGVVTAEACSYVAKYIQKSIGPGVDGSPDTGRESPFTLKSLGLGRAWCIKNGGDIWNSKSLSVKGTRIGIPRYYKTILGLSDYFAEEGERRDSELIMAWLQQHGASVLTGDLEAKLYDYLRSVRSNKRNHIVKKDAIRSERSSLMNELLNT